MNIEQIDSAPISLLLSSVFFLLAFIVTTYIAKSKNFLTLPLKNYTGTYISGIDVFISLILFILTFSLLNQIVIEKIYSMVMTIINSTGYVDLSPEILANSLTHIALSLIYLIFISLYSFTSKTFSLLPLIKDFSFPYKLSVYKDSLVGLIALILAIFPLNCVINLLEAIYTALSIKPINQSALNVLLNSRENSVAFALEIFTIVILAPCIEEFLFRGVIQTYLRKKYRSIRAIIYSSFIFSIIHFSVGQGSYNILILISIFILGLYLGFIYEKTRSLISSITLHVTFNLINVIKIFFYEI